MHVAWYRGIGIKKYGHIDFHKPDLKMKRPKQPTRVLSPRGALAALRRLAS
jgi:hypothetical protein